jgi:hypothetical protein
VFVAFYTRYHSTRPMHEKLSQDTDHRAC